MNVERRNHYDRKVGQRLVLAAVTLCAAILGPSLVRAQDGEVDYTDFSLSELLQTDVVYGASKFEQQAKYAPSSVTIVTAEEIKGFGYRSLAEILASVRGFYSTYDRNYAYIGARGFGRPGDYNSRILVMIDGVRINENIYESVGVENVFPLDIDLIQRVEIVRGPSSSLYGTSAIFAIVNVITRSPHEYGKVQVTGEGGSYGTLRGQVVVSRDGGPDRLSWLVSGSTARTDGQDFYFPEFDTPETNNGVFVAGDSSKWHRLFAKVSHGPWHMEGLYGWQEKHIPTAPWGTYFNDPGTMTTDEQGHLAAWYEGKLGSDNELLARATFGGADYEGSWIYDYADEGDPPFVVTNKDNSIGRWLTSDIQLTRHLAAGHVLALGGEYRQNLKQDQAVWDEDPYWSYIDDRRDSDNGAVYALGDLKVRDNLRLNGGLRYDHYESFGATTNPRLALMFEPLNGSVVKALYGSAFRTPNLYELYYNDGGETQKENPDLEPETIKTYELVWDQRLGRSAHGSVSFFKYDIQDLIDQEEDPADELLVFRNGDEVESTGLELELRTRIHSGIKSTLSYSYQSTRTVADDEYLTNSPRHMVKFGLLAPLHGVTTTAGLQVSYSSERRTVRGNQVAGYALANLTIAHAPLSLPFEFRGGVYNLLDKAYAHPGGTEHAQDTLAQDGRNFRAVVIWRH